MALLGIAHVAGEVPGLGLRERLEKGIGYLSEAVHRQREQRDSLKLLDSLNMLGNSQWIVGAFREASATFEETRLIAEQMGLSYPGSCAHLNLAMQAFELGDCAGLSGHAKQAAELARAGKYQDYEAIAHALASLGFAFAGQEDQAAQAEAVALRLLTLLPPAVQPGYKIVILPYLAERHRIAGNLEQAWAAANEAWDLMTSTETKEYEQMLLALLGDLRLRRGDIDGARAAFGTALSLAETVRAKGSIGRAKKGLGNVAMVDGHHAEALLLLNEASSLLKEFGSIAVAAECAALISETQSLPAIRSEVL